MSGSGNDHTDVNRGTHRDQPASAPVSGGNSSAPTSPGRLNPDVKAFEAPGAPGYMSQSAPTSPDRDSFAGFDPRDRLLRHLNYYFSIENLMKDSYLLSHMNAEYYVPCSLIASFPAVQKLTTDLDLVVELLRTIPTIQVTVDGSMVRPMMMPPQAYMMPMTGAAGTFLPPMASLTLSERVTDATEDDIAGLFDESALPLALLKDEGSNRWVARFPTDESAKLAAQHLATTPFQGQHVEAEVEVDKAPRPGQFAPAAGGYDPRFQPPYYGGVYPAQFGYGIPMYGYPPQYVFDGSMQGFQQRPPGGQGGGGGGGG
eukprot:m.59844 g.59844  ORF g.59844 m.59844 type:complete len:315 (-) comp7915_c0_seq2:80-1024(-)